MIAGNQSGMDDKKLDIFKIGIISGKGGVGKTTLSGSLSVLLRENFENIVAADCDVDAPNLGLLFKGGKIIDEFTTKTTEKASFNPEKCLQCRKCMDDKFCQFSALSWDYAKNYPIIDDFACEGCGACAILCPEGAFDIYAVDSGFIRYENSPYGFPLVWGETKLGATTSGKLVTEIKKYVEKIVKPETPTIVIIDGPPGIGCPVVATVSDLDYIVVVIEPTSSALHDAERAIGVLRQLNRNFGIVINKADAWKDGYQKILDFAENENIPIVGEIPVDNNIPNATVKGIPVYKHNPESPAATNIVKIFDYIKAGIIPEKYQ